MKVFFDTEFSGLHQSTQLISIGCITEKGRTFYAESTDFDQSIFDHNIWLKENVLPGLSLQAKNRDPSSPFWEWSNHGDVEIFDTRNEIALSLDAWLQEQLNIPVNLVSDSHSEEPKEINAPLIEMISDCYAYDWVLFCDLYGGALNIPKCIYYIPFDISTLFKAANIDPDINREEFADSILTHENTQKHNALWDARVIKACFEKLKEILGITEW